MKRILFKKIYPFAGFFLLSLLSLSLHAQENQGGSTNTGSTSTKTVTTETTTTEWFSEPWVWVVGGAVLLIILVALLRGSGSSTKEVSRTTVIKD